MNVDIDTFEEDSSSVEYKPHENPLAIMLAPTGMLPVKPEMEGRVKTPYVPISPNEIIETTISCYELGISGVHLHARDKNGLPSQEPEDYSVLIEGIRKYCPDIVIGVTTSGRKDGTLEGRSKVLYTEGIDVASLTVNSIQFHDKTVVADISIIKDLCLIMNNLNIKPEFEFFDYGGINIVKQFQRNGIIKDNPIYCNIILGNFASTQANLTDLIRMVNQIPTGSYVGIAGIGKFQTKMNIASIIIGGRTHIRVGIEDNIYYDSKRTILATNQMLVKRIVDMALIFERPIATPAVMRKLIGI